MSGPALSEAFRRLSGASCGQRLPSFAAAPRDVEADAAFKRRAGGGCLHSQRRSR